MLCALSLSGGASKRANDGIELLGLRAGRASSERKEGTVDTIGSRFPSDRGPRNIELESTRADGW